MSARWRDVSSGWIRMTLNCTSLRASEISRRIWEREKRESAKRFRRRGAERHGGMTIKRKREIWEVREVARRREERRRIRIRSSGRKRDETNVRSRTEAKQEERLRLQSLHRRVNMCNLDTVLARGRSTIFLLKNDTARAVVCEKKSMWSSVGCGQSGRENWQCTSWACITANWIQRNTQIHTEREREGGGRERWKQDDTSVCII